MARPTDLKDRVTTMVSLERDEYHRFETLVGKGNVSKEIRAFIKERVDLEKNEKARQLDPLNLLNKTDKNTPLSNNTRQSTLFETFGHRDRRDEIVKFVHSVKDPVTLNQIEQNCKCMLKVSETHRRRII